MLFLQLIVAAFLAMANPLHTTTNSDGTPVTTNAEGEPGDGEGDGGNGTGDDDGTGGSGTTGNTSQTPPPKP